MHCGDQRHLGLCLGYVPALAYGSCKVSDQGTTLRASDLHNARSTILNPFNKPPTLSFEGESDNAQTEYTFIPQTATADFGSLVGEAVSAKVRAKILANQYVDLAELLPQYSRQQAEEYLFRPDANNGTGGYDQKQAIHNLPILQWVEAFDVFTAVYLGRAQSKEELLYDILGSPQSRDLGHYNLEFQVVVRNLEIGMRLVSPPDGHSENHDWRSVSHVCQLPRQLAAFETYLMAHYDTGIFTDV